MNPMHDTSQEKAFSVFVAGVARGLSEMPEQGGFSTGEVAQLRRAERDGDYQPAFWRTMARWRDLETLPKRELRLWGLILSGMARMAPRPHLRGAHPGKVLAQVELAESRMLRLLHARGIAFDSAVRSTCRYLAAKGASLDWVSFAGYILARGDESRERTRRNMAAHYYGQTQTETKKEKGS